MGRLVDIDAVIKAVDRHTKDESEVVLDNDITCILEEVPTAYDVEKVVAELEEESYSTTDIVCGGRFDAIRLNSAIGIVKRGGVE